jgi:hypothetical protein
MTLKPNLESEEKIMRRAISLRLTIALAAFCLPLVQNFASAQQSKESLSKEQKPVVAYRIELSVREVEDGKRLNSRNYMIVAEDGAPAKIRVGNRVPTITGQSFSYHDVGMNIDCTPHERGDSVALAINVNFSGIAPQTQTAAERTEAESKTQAAPANPVFRTDETSLEPIVTLGKPTLVASMDDVITNRRYEIEVTATKVK